MTERIAVIGAGVIGLSVAHELAAAGHAVELLHERPPLETTSAVAGAIWFPYAAEQSADVDRMLDASLARFQRIAAEQPEAGVDLRAGTIVERTPDPDRSWTRHVAAVEADAGALPAGATGMRATLPLATMSQYLPWLEAQCRALGVGFQQRRIDDLDEVDADAVVVCTGLGARDLLGDDELHPIRGQVVRVENPGVDEFWIDDDAPAGLTYLLPRRDCLVLGGTHEHSGESEPDPATERSIIERCADVVPAVADARILSRAVGLRPARPRLRIERHAVRRPTIAAVGHGGSGMTLSWGTAERVAAMLA